MDAPIDPLALDPLGPLGVEPFEPFPVALEVASLSPAEATIPTRRIVVVGGSGLIGSRLVTKLEAHRHVAVAASPTFGVDTVTGDGLAAILDGAAVVVDASNSPTFDDAAALEFFRTSTSNLLAAEAAAGVGHHVVLSIVGTERLSASGYFRGKLAQEQLVRDSPIPWSIVRATQFFEFMRVIAAMATHGGICRLAPVRFQPMAADDVAHAVGRVALGPPLNASLEVAGPEQFRLDELIRHGLRAYDDSREVIADPRARYFGAVLTERTLVPGVDARLGVTRFEDWLTQTTASLHESRLTT